MLVDHVACWTKFAKIDCGDVGVTVPPGKAGVGGGVDAECPRLSTPWGTLRPSELLSGRAATWKDQPTTSIRSPSELVMPSMMAFLRLPRSVIVSPLLMMNQSAPALPVSLSVVESWTSPSALLSEGSLAYPDRE